MRLPRLGISACLLGNRVRYDGAHAMDHYMSCTLGKYVEWLPICPEVECGLPVPREPMRLVSSQGGPRLVTLNSGIDHTGRMNAWIRRKLAGLKALELDGFIFKSKSPSSGMSGIRIHSADGVPEAKGAGLFAGAFMKAFPLIPCEDEVRLKDPAVRENFIERVIVLNRWKEYISGGMSMKGLVGFHTEMKYLAMAHSPRHYRILGRIAANPAKSGPRAVHSEYIRVLMEGLRLQATASKNTNVLLHIMGYFKKSISSTAKAELSDIIERYRRGRIPLRVPLTLLNHYAGEYHQEYLKRQYYLNPRPEELILRYHV